MGKGMLLVISGFSGAGKGTVIGILRNAHEGYALSVSATTRSPRPGEVDGVHYHFLSREEFERIIAEDGFLEYARYVDNYYGTPRDFVQKELDEGKTVILEIELQGARKVREIFPDANFIFIAPPSAKALKDRLIGRDSADSPSIPGRIARAKEEAKYMDEYDYILVNDVAEDCAEALHELTQALRQKTANQKDFVKDMKEQINKL